MNTGVLSRQSFTNAVRSRPSAAPAPIASNPISSHEPLAFSDPQPTHSGLAGQYAASVPQPVEMGNSALEAETSLLDVGDVPDHTAHAKTTSMLLKGDSASKESGSPSNTLMTLAHAGVSLVAGTGVYMMPNYVEAFRKFVTDEDGTLDERKVRMYAVAASLVIFFILETFNK